MKRRQFGAMLATATLSLGGVAGAAAETSAQDTDSLQVEDVSVNLGGVTASVGSATLAHDGGTMQFQATDWTMESDARSVSMAAASVAVDDVSTETYAALRDAMVESVQGRSPSALVDAAVEADVDPDSQVRLLAESVAMDGEPMADQVTATGTVGSVVADGTRDLIQSGPTVEGMAALGSSEWSEVTVQRGNAELVAADVVMERDGGAFAVSSPSGTATVSGRAFEFSEMEMHLLPPETIPAEHVEFAAEVREAAAEGDLSVSTLQSAADEAGVTAENTEAAAREVRFELSFAEVTEGGEVVVQDFATSGTLGELAATLRQEA